MNAPAKNSLSTSLIDSHSGVLHFGFIVTGIATTLLGPILPELSSRSSLSDARAGLFFVAQFLGSMSGVAISSFLLPRRGFRFTVATGFALTGAGIAALAVDSWTIGLLATAIYGCGLGLTITGSNLFVAEAFPARRAAALSLLNFAWGVGAILCPLLAMIALRSNRLDTFLGGIAVCNALSAVAVAVLLNDPIPAKTSKKDPAERTENRAWKGGFLLALGLLFFLYVGTENAAAGWVASYAKRLNPTTGVDWITTPSYFWAALLLGRAVAPALLRILPEKSFAVGSLMISFVGACVLVWAPSSLTVKLSVLLVGVGLAVIYPILVAWLSESLGSAARRIGSVLFALAGLGGATLPWIVGLASAYWRTLRAGLVVPLVAILVMIFVTWAIAPKPFRVQRDLE